MSVDRTEFFSWVWIALAVIVVIVLSRVYLGHRCDVRWGESGIEYRFDFTDGCAVKHRGKWIPEQTYTPCMEAK
jgi:hypothetical protein